MSFLTSILPAVGTALGTFIGGPAGGAIGGSIGGGIAGNSAAQSVTDNANSTNAMNLQIAQANNAFNADQAQKNRDFQQQSIFQQESFQNNESSSAWQRGVKDMEAAGLNPMLAYSQGGASTPSGSSASGSTASASGNPVMQQSAGAAVQAAMQAASSAASVDNLQANARKANSEALVNAAMVPEIQQRVRTGQSSAGQMEATTKRILALLEPEVDLTKGEAALKSVQYNTEVGRSKSALAEGDFAHKYFQSRATGTAANAALSELGIPEAQNAAHAQGTWWMKNVSPYLPDVLKSAHSAGSASRLFR